MKKKLIFLCALLLMLTGCSAKSEKVKIGAAGLGGTYRVFCDTFADIASEGEESPVLEVKTTAGSAANLRLLSEDYIQLAIAQNDMANNAYYGVENFKDKEKYQGYGAVASLYTEACQIVVREDSNIKSIDDLQGKTVSIGEEESGTELNATQILDVYGLSDKLVKRVNLNYADAAKELESGKIDAFFCTAGTQTTVIEELARQCGIRLLDIDDTGRQKLLNSYDSYTECIIPKGTYQGQEEDVQTVGVKALLLASNELSADKVQELTKMLFENEEKLQYTLPVDISLDEKSSVEGVTIPFHKGAANYYKDKEISVEEAIQE